jgi:hypothetical protein
MRKWFPLLILASAQFVMVLDSSVMNVAISQIVKDLDIVPVADVERAVVKGGLTSDEARAVADDYGDAQLDALRLALGAVAVAALLSLWLTRKLPAHSLAESEVAAA